MDPFVFGVDLDGVCGDYTTAFRTIVASELGVSEDALPEARSWDFHEWNLDAAGGFERLHALAVTEHHMFATMPPIDGVADALWRLSDAGVWIRVITHRLYVNWGHASAVADTVSWLDDHRIPYRDICFLGNKPDVGADAYVDDAAWKHAAPVVHQAAVVSKVVGDVLQVGRPAHTGKTFEVTRNRHVSRIPLTVNDRRPWEERVDPANVQEVQDDNPSDNNL